jgi:3-oxoacyl-[acyl-carrier protein] reductase
MELKDKVALITGSTRGIGLAIAEQMARGGASVVLNASREVPTDVLDRLRSYGHPVLALPAAIDDADAVAAMYAQIIAEFGRIDILVNNAGITADALATRMTPADFARVIAVNLQGTFNVTQPVFAGMQKARAGVIINMASVVGLTGNIGQANYATSKAGVIGLTKSLAKEGARRGVRVNAIAPGMIATAMTAKLSSSVQEKLNAAIPLRRFGTVAEVADAAAFLVRNDYVTGQVLTIDGGLVM